MTTRAARVAAPLSGLAVRLAAWGVGPVAVAGAHFALIDAHPIARMCVFVGVLFLWMKCVVLAEHRAAGRRFPSLPRILAWTLLWPGMRLVDIAQTRQLNDSGGYFVRGVANIALGLGFILIGLWIASWNWWLTYGWWFILVGVPSIMVGMSLILHFGLFHMITGEWREHDFNVGPLFRNPLTSRSLPDFWTHRWNLAYVEMCQETVLRVTRPLGRRTSSLLVFLFSGLLHEVAISLPVQQGYGLPLIYFALNGAAIQVSAMFRKGSIPARLWAAFWVIAPLPLLFHWPFIAQVLLPIVGIQP